MLTAPLTVACRATDLQEFVLFYEKFRLGPTIAGKTHDKKAADAASIVYPGNATLDKDTGFQGYEPAGILTAQPKKSRKVGYGAQGSSS